jgi:hypothetical protein
MPLDAVGELRDEHQRKMADRLGCGTRTLAGKQRYGAAWRGSSVVDITWATSELYPRIHDWRVAEGVETLSDHLYIFMEVVSEDVDENNNQVARGGASRSGPSQPLRWRLKERDREMLRAAAIVSAWSWDTRGTTSLGSVDEEAEILQGYMSAA